ncbi:MAG: hypothetical protein JWN70_4931 [Planctomycetaceae bacterium]|nr:hypothetical protein [Planctomycetaceae bacterium]
MVLNSRHYWSQLTAWWSAPQRRRTGRSFHITETLESRCLLSAVTHHGRHIQADVQTVDDTTADSELAKPPHGAKAGFPVMDVYGQWDLVYRNLEGFHGLLSINQKGKKLSCTLANDGQPTTKFTAHFVKKVPIADTAVGKGLNFVVASKKTKLVLHFVDANADTFPETGDGHWTGQDGDVDFDLARRPV